MADTHSIIDSLNERISKLEKYWIDTAVEQTELKVRLRNWNRSCYLRKIRKFQTKCIQIAKEILNEEPIIEYRPSFLNGLELDAFFQKYQIVLEVQGSQHRLHNTSWYKDVKKLEDIVNRDRKKRCLCQLNGIYLIETWYDENPEVTIPEKIYKYREEIFNLS
ncbi:415_t:CDS:1 [Entrophospora sp. SA101]|nr:2647_t:CDS:1 [Entrophospora sp. SA101]CAJ0824755.1 9561_t:CDS:1 [Entrophospora sp. SA101]CAJ0884531.1 415_t:CDS:1 [Entrophospora sp. SA101]